MIVAFATCLWGSRAQAQRRRRRRAGGVVRVVRRRLREHDEAWRLLLRVRLPRVPDREMVRLDFDFTQVVDFRPGEEDGKPRKVPVDPPRQLSKTQRVDMRDVRGEVGVRARAELSLQRKEGFRAGVWLLDVTGPDGPVGRPARLTLRGTNPEPPDPVPDAGPDAPAQKASFPCPGSAPPPPRSSP